MSEFGFSLGKDLEQAFNSIGCSVLQDDFAAKLLAYVYVMGGANEAVTHSEKLNAEIGMAQQKFNLFGGETPDAKGAGLIKKYAAELEAGMEDTEWLGEVLDRYNLARRKQHDRRRA